MGTQRRPWGPKGTHVRPYRLLPLLLGSGVNGASIVPPLSLMSLAHMFVFLSLPSLLLGPTCADVGCT